MSGRIINKRKTNYTVIPNEIIRAKDLTWKAKGLMCYLLSLSDEWTVHKSDLSNRSLDGYDSMITGWNELEKLGYIQTVRVKENNLFKGYNYIIHDSRVRDFTEQENTEQENPQLISNSLKQVTLSLDTKVSIDRSFETFWKLYPIKSGKAKCEKKWTNISNADKDKIMSTINEFLNYKPFATYSLPYPLTYLNGERWNDSLGKEEISEETKNDNTPDIGDLYAQFRGE